ncbi:DUF2062 domain-containing protein [Aliidiomarina taiwanensis]|uniref:DUF2062 domain-containing protein n=1 Tax=Aliidiomarina taiwanensis TaxID=946228 RepID=A0A432XAG3_9GAMM|nr:DUF2062 domain-containing protein [Aliidiomarina taiwanensis]RUO44393.1 DUF2062 domain-containing protein [Aliidiomarina taiwanensis]
MPKKFIQRYLPDPSKLKTGKSLRIFGRLSQNTNLWYLNRRSAAGAFAVGLFVAFLPLPAHMLMAAGLAILLRVNLPLSVALVWITNPITITPVMLAAYKIGSVLLQHPPQPFHFEWSFEWIRSGFTTVLPPILVGSVLMGTVSAVVGYITVRTLWRQAVRKAWRERAHARQVKTVAAKQQVLTVKHDTQGKE